MARTDGRWQMADGRWPMADGRWQMADGIGSNSPLAICHWPFRVPPEEVWMRRHPVRSLLLLLILTTAAPAAVSAQTSSGSIVGRVLDTQGQAVPGATVTLTRQDTRETRTFTSDAVGQFVFAAIEPGTYDVAVDLQGFK